MNEHTMFAPSGPDISGEGADGIGKDQRTWTEEQELNAVITDVAEALAAPDSDDNDAYDRCFSVDFPELAGIIHGIDEIVVSKRDFLTWFAEAYPENARQVLALRDNFYAGDDEFDYGYEMSPSLHQITPEERAAAVVKRRESEADRMRTAASVAEGIALSEERERATWQPFLMEKVDLEEKRKALSDRADALDSEWEALVSDAITSKPDCNLDERRKELEAKTKALVDAQEKWSEQWGELLSKVERHAARRRKT